MKKGSNLAKLAFVGIAVSLISVVPAMAADEVAPTDTTKPMTAPADTTKPMMVPAADAMAPADSTKPMMVPAADAMAPADTTKPMKKKNKKHKKAMADSSSKM